VILEKLEEDNTQGNSWNLHYNYIYKYTGGLTIKFANLPPCACRGSSGQKPQYDFDDTDDIRRNTTEALKVIPQNQFQNCFAGWTRRWHLCIASQGEYFEGDHSDIQQWCMQHFYRDELTNLLSLSLSLSLSHTHTRARTRARARTRTHTHMCL
jgi:hypothetical protein